MTDAFAPLLRRGSIFRSQARRGCLTPAAISILPFISTELMLSNMLMKALEQLRHAGVRVDSIAVLPRGCDALFDLEVDGVSHRFAIEEKRRAPYPSEIEPFLIQHKELSRYGTPLLVAPYISEGVGNILIEHGWSWADEAGNFDLRASGLRLRQRVSSARPKATHRALPQGPGALTIIRFLISQSDEWTGFGPTELANIASVSQPRASQVLSRLHKAGLVERVDDGWRPTDREALLDAFLNSYRGPGGTELYFYSLDAAPKAALETVNALASEQTRIAVSADVGPDLIAPWRSPTLAIVYADHVVDAASLRLVRAKSRSDANVILRVPEDTSVFRSPPLEAELAGAPIPLADEVQMIWDLHDLGGDDRVEAAGELKKWLLRSR